MKKMLLLSLVLVVAFCFCLMLAACEPSTPDAHVHEWGDWVVTKEASCIGKGTRTRTCECGETADESIDSLGHSYGEYHTSLEPTCTEKGKDVATCVRCSATVTQIVEVLGHSYENDVCVRCGIDRVSEGLQYSMSSDKRSYILTGLGNNMDYDVIIPRTYLSLPVTRIGVRAFKGCVRTSITIPDTVTSIGTEAFAFCGSLTSIVIPDSVTEIGSGAFAGCVNLESITVPFVGSKAGATEPSTTTLFGYLFGTGNYTGSKAAKQFFAYNPPNEGGWNDRWGRDKETWNGATYYLPSKLENVTITGGTSEQGESLLYGAFSACGAIKNITLGENVVSIGDNAFSGCASLEKVSFADNISYMYVGEDAFKDCDQIVYNSYDNAEYLGNSSNPYLLLAKAKSTSIVNCEVNENAITICGNAFAECSKLETLTMSDKITSIGGKAFYNCEALKGLDMSDNLIIIGSNAFYGCIRMTTVVIPDSVETIAEYAFSNCRGLTSITVGNSVANIGEKAFENCYSLVEICNKSSINIEKASETNGGIGYYALNIYAPGIGESKLITQGDFIFYSDNAINLLIEYTGEDSDVVLPDDYNGVKYDVNSYAFSYSANITGIAVSNGVNKIMSGAFYSCVNLVNISISSSVSYIGDYAFGACSSLNSVFFPENVVEIGIGLFANCSKLSEVKFGSAITAYNDEMFYNCTNIKELNIPANVSKIGNYAFYGCTGLTDLNITTTVTEIGEYAFAKCSEIVEVEINSSLTTVGKGAFEECSKLEKVNYNGNIGQWASISFGNETANPLYNASEIYISGSLLQGDITIDGIEAIGDYAFYGRNELTGVTIGESVKEMGKYVFSGCENIKSAIIIGQIDKIDDGVFYRCTALEKVVMPESVSGIGNHAFYNCKSLNKIEMPEVITYIGNYAFYGCELLKELVIPAETTSIGMAAFYGCKGLTNVVISDKVKTVGNYAFYGCRSLLSVTVGASVESIGGYAFDGCYTLVEIYNKAALGMSAGEYGRRGGINGNIARYALNIYTSKNGSSKLYYTDDNYVFYVDGSEISLVGYIGDESAIVLPDSYEGNTYRINNYTFANTDIESITLSKGVTNIGAYAFYNSSKLKNLVLGENIDVISQYALYGCSGLTSLELPDSLTSISYAALAGCSGIKSLVLPGSVTFIGESAFYNCSSLVSITMSGGITNIGKNAFRGCAKLSEVYYEGTIDSWIAIIFENRMSNPMYFASSFIMNNEELTEITIPNTIGAIKSYTFYGFENVKTVIFPDSLRTIEAQAFYGCSGLTTLKFGTGIVEVKQAAFEGCVSLKDVYYMGDILGWCDIVFESENASPMNYAENLYINGNKLTELIIGDNITEIKPYTFYGYTTLISVKIGSGVVKIGEGAFKNCTALVNLDIGSGVKEIGVSAFYGCVSLKNVVIPDNVELIDSQAFYGCGITDISLGSGVLDVVANAFGGNSELATITLSGNNKNFVVDGNCLILTVTKTIVLGCASSVIPDYVETIGDYAFYGSVITSMTLPDTILYVGARAFGECLSLTEFTFGVGTVEIDPTAFYGCVNLMSLNVNLNNVNFYSSNNCVIDSAVGTLIVGCAGSQIPDGIAIIGDNAFFGSGLKTVEMPQSVTQIGKYAYAYCSLLTEINIGAGVTQLGEYAFSYCTALEEVEISGAVTNVSMGLFYGCTALKNVMFGEGVTSISAYAFAGCDSLITIMIPSTIKDVRNSSLVYTANLEKIYYGGEADAFEDIVSYSRQDRTAITVDIYGYSERDPGVEGKYWHYNEDGVIVEW